jgi:hypothetical protein
LINIEKMKSYSLILIAFLLLPACKSSRIQEEPQKVNITANSMGTGTVVTLEFSRGKSYNHPSFVLWAEDMEGNHLQTLFITRAVGTSIYEHGDPSSGQWVPGEIRRPATLPYWAHKRGVKEKDGLYLPTLENPIPDAYTGATPQGDFSLETRFDGTAPREFRILFEINQTWDWNEYWTNNKYPDDAEYKTSCQPAVVYAVEVDLDDLASSYTLKVAGHSHYAGKTGELFTDLSTLTTALDIVRKLSIKLD